VGSAGIKYVVGSRGCLNTVPLLAVEHPEPGEPWPPQPVLVTALPSGNGTRNTSSSSSSKGGVAASAATAAVAAAAAAAGNPPTAIRTGSGSSEGGLLSPTSRLSKLLRSLSSRGGSEQRGEASGAPSRAPADPAPGFVPPQLPLPPQIHQQSQTALPEPGGTATGDSEWNLQPPAAATQDVLQHRQQLYTVQPTPAGSAGPAAACAAGWLSTVSSVEADPAGSSGRLQMMSRRPRPADWAAAMDDRDPDLAAAIAASLEDQQQCADDRVDACAAARRVHGGAAVVQQAQLHHHHHHLHQQQQLHHQGPVSAEEEADMLRKAIEMSLVEAGLQQGPGVEMERHGVQCAAGSPGVAALGGIGRREDRDEAQPHLKLGR